jgi:signal peptidase I
VRGAVATAATLALVGFWAVALRPPDLGGATDYVVVAGHSMEPTLHTGDFVVVRRRARYRRGDVIAYRVPRGEPGAGALVIHRVIGGSARTGYRVQGDNRRLPDLWRPRPADIAGRMRVHVPQLGRRLAALRTPGGFAAVAAALVFLLLEIPGTRRPREGRVSDGPDAANPAS